MKFNLVLRELDHVAVNAATSLVDSPCIESISQLDWEMIPRVEDEIKLAGDAFGHRVTEVIISLSDQKEVDTITVYADSISRQVHKAILKKV